MTRKFVTVGAFFASTVLALAVAPRMLGQATAPAPAPAPATGTAETGEETVKLNPFVVTAEEDQGYQANATLASTRIRTAIKDVGSSISIVTQQFLQDTNSKNMEDLLVYTTGTEVAGQGGNFLGQGDGRFLTNANVSRPVANTRVRGLATADNTRDFYLSDIPWDSYNVGRVDLQRGPNAILFGIGSPAGIVNSSLNHAAFKNSYKLENQVGSFGTYRFTVDLNQVLIPRQLAVRVAALDDQTKYRQAPAYKDDKRIFAAIRYDPEMLNRGSIRTQFEANFEKGRQLREDPMQTPPLDAITPWFFAYNAAQRAAGFNTADPSVTTGSLNTSDPNVARYGIYLGNYNNNRPGQLAQTDPWLGAPGNRVFDGVITAYNGGSPTYLYAAQVKPWPNTGGTPPGTPLGANIIRGIATYDLYANNAQLVGSTIGAFKARSLTDPTIFDFYNNLIYGPNAQQFNRFHAFNLSARQTYWDDRVGVELTYDKQHARFGNWTLVSNDATSVSIDLMKTLIDGSANPNFARPVTYAGGGSAGGNWEERDRAVVRATAYVDIDLKDFAGKDSILTWLLGRNTVTGLWTRQKTDDIQANYNLYYIDDSFVPEAGQGAVGQASRDDIFAIYLGAPLTGSSAHNANLSGIKTTIHAPGSQTINYYNNVTNAWQTLPLNLVDNSQASDRQKTYRTARKTKDIVTSQAGVWQGYWFDGMLVPMFGYRSDKDQFWDAGNPPAVPSNAYGKGGLVDIWDPAWRLPDRANSTITVRSKTWDFVTHLPNSLRAKLPGRMDVSLIYDRSQNFSPDSSRRDIMGHTVPNPAGDTKEYGVAITMLDDRLVLKWMHYKTSVTNATLDSNGIANQYLIGAVEAWGQHAAYTFRQSLAAGGPLNWPASTLYGYTSDGHQVTWQPDGNTVAAQTGDPAHPYAYTQAQLDATYAKEKASTDAWFAQQVPADFQTAWALTDYATGGGSTNYGASGLVVTGDTVSIGNEFELIANPIKGLNISLNASKTSASRVHLEQGYVAWITYRWNQFLTTPSGDMRLWGAQNDGSYPDLNGAFGQGGETARGKFARETMAGYNLFQALEGADVPELRPWRFNLTANYNFQRPSLRGVNVGGSYRWQQRNVTGFPIIGSGTAVDPYKFDVHHPYKGADEGIFDLWVGYQRKLPWRGVTWRVQLNVRNVLANDHLAKVTVEPDGTGAAYRIPEPRTITLTNGFEF